MSGAVAVTHVQRNAHDAEIRNALLEMMGDHKPPERMLVQEWALPRGIADVATIALDCIAGYEIKSAADSVTRLPGQIKAYGEVFDTCTLVTADNHIKHAAKVLPPWWGIWAWREGRIVVERIGGQNVTNNSVRLLWSNELSRLLTELGLRERAREEQFRIDSQWCVSVRPRRRAPTKDAMMAAVPMSTDVRAWVARCLIARPGWRLENGRSARQL